VGDLHSIGLKPAKLTKLVSIFLAQAGYQELANASREAWARSMPAYPATSENKVEGDILEANNGGIECERMEAKAGSGKTTTGDNNEANW
jgi:hypothetical protein